MSVSDTINWGIDLGTTNSSLAIQQGDRILTVSNPRAGGDTMPSAVSIRDVDGRRVVVVGITAKQRGKEDPNAVALEFKQMMGMPDWHHQFAAGIAAPAFELSGYVLAELTRWPASNFPKLVTAIIGVPAAFQNHQYDATEKAGRQAGIEYVELLPEPVAASLAFAHKADAAGNRLWLAYDLGGGTFDAALVRGEQGIFSVIDHAGDPNLGGKHLDNEIIMELIHPQLPPNVQKEVVPWKSTYWWTLKLAVEEAKCLLSTDSEALVEAKLGGHKVSVWLSQEQVNALQVKIFGRTLDLCRTLLQRNGFRSADIEKVLMVGGPTKSPFLRQLVEKGADLGSTAVEGLGIPLDCSVDPLTAVAQGAALYAAGRPIPQDQVSKLKGTSATPAEILIELNYPRQVVEEEVLLSGTLRRQRGGATLPSWSVVVTRLDVHGSVSWQSPPIPVSDVGKFGKRLPLIPGENHFRVEVADAQGRQVSADDEQFKIVQGITTSEATLPRSIGVADKFGRSRWIFRKGDTPGTHSEFFHTTLPLVKGRAGTVLAIPVVEGTNEKASLNQLIYTLEVTADQVTTDIPVGTELEVELTINESRQITMAARFLALDIELKSDLPSWHLDVEELRKSFDTAKSDFELFQKVAAQSSEIAEVVQRIGELGLFSELEIKIGLAADANQEMAVQAQGRLMELLQLMDPHLETVNRLLEWEQHEQYCDRNINKAIGSFANAHRGVILKTRVMRALCGGTVW
jgi:molecular chaperone DnaK